MSSLERFKYKLGRKTVETVVGCVRKSVGRRLLAISALALLSAGCSPQGFSVREGALSEAEPTALVAATPTPAPTPGAPSPTPSTTPSTTPTPAPATPTPTPMATATPAPTPTPTQAELYQKCLDVSEQTFSAQTASMLLWYKAHGKRVPVGDALPKFYRAAAGTENRKVVVMVHGFLASPAYMKDLATSVASQGYTVVVPLLLGFGANEQAANATDPAEWRASIQFAIDVAKMCHPNLDMVAHSLGAGLTTDLIANKGVSGVDHLVLLAPYFKIGSGYMQAALDVFGLVTDSVAVKELNRYLPWDFYDVLGLAQPLPGEAEPFLPIDATQKVLDLHAVFERTQYNGRSTGPKVFTVLTEADVIIKNSWAQYYPKMRFGNLTEFSYPLAEKIPHSLQTRANNPHFDDFAKQVQDFLAQP